MKLISYTSNLKYLKVKGNCKDTIQLGGMTSYISESKLTDGRHLFLDQLEKPVISTGFLIIPSKYKGTLQSLLKLGNFNYVISSNLKYIKLVEKRKIIVWYYKTSKSNTINKTNNTFFIRIKGTLEI